MNLMVLVPFHDYKVTQASINPDFIVGKQEKRDDT